MTQPFDYRLADGTETVQTPAFNAPGRNIVAALGNIASCDATQTVVHTPSAATKTGFLAVKLTAKSSGVFDLNMTCQIAGVAADTITLTVDIYTDSTPGTPLTLPANAAAVGANCFEDNSGAGITPSAGATVAHTITAPATTLGTGQANGSYSFDGIVALGANPIPKGQTFYAVFSVTNSVAARAITQATCGAFEVG